MRKNRGESSDEEGLLQDELASYRDLETFQKAQLRQKVRNKDTFNLEKKNTFVKSEETLG